MESRGIPTVMVIADSFVSFARRIAAAQGYSHVVVASTPNPIQDLEILALRKRAEAMMDTIVDGLTLPPADIERRLDAAVHGHGGVEAKTTTAPAP
jgi:hypothetical protein